MSDQTGTPAAGSPESSSMGCLPNRGQLGACMDSCGAPCGGSARLLWLGLMLLLGSFSLKLVVLDFAISNGSSSLGIPRAEMQGQAKLSAVRADLEDVDYEIEEIEGKIASARRAALEEGAKDMDDVIDKLDERRKEKREERRKIETKLADKEQRVRLDGRKAKDRAMRKAAGNGADAIGWAQTALSWKFLVDLVKILGCFLVLHATVCIVSSRDEETALKVFATCCGTVVLLSVTAWALLSYLS